ASGGERSAHTLLEERRIGAAADEQDVDGAALREHGSERLDVDLADGGDRPGPDAGGQSEDRAAMAHAAEMEAALAIGLDQVPAREEGRGICHYTSIASMKGAFDIGTAPCAVTSTCCSSLTPSLRPTSPI